MEALNSIQNSKIPIHNGTLAIIDILGFREIVDNDELQNVVDEYAHVITGATFASKVTDVDIDMMVYSDTIAIKLNDESEKGFLKFIKTIQLLSHNFFYNLCFPYKKQYPLRGAIVFGEFAWHKGYIQSLGNQIMLKSQFSNFIVGKAIIDAHDFESKQKWIGIAINNKNSAKFQELYPNAINKLTKEKYLIEYDIPCANKDGDYFEKGYVVNAVGRTRYTESMHGLKDLIETNQDKWHPPVLKKYKNTYEFYQYVIDHNWQRPFYPNHPDLNT